MIMNDVTIYRWLIPKILVDPDYSRISIDETLNKEDVLIISNFMNSLEKRFVETTISFTFIVVDDLVDWYWGKQGFKGIRNAKRSFKKLEDNYKKTLITLTQSTVVTSVSTLRVENPFNQYSSFQEKSMQILSNDNLIPDSFEQEIDYRMTAYCQPNKAFSPSYAEELAKRAYSLFVAEYSLLTLCSIGKQSLIYSNGSLLSENRYKFAESVCNYSSIKRISQKI